ncbi:MAG: hypothetical protein GY896_21075 [Gammaproteobacteria bacterium]|nr:hypothetical protein [Gammaproteobacteria bacterium]
MPVRPVPAGQETITQHAWLQARTSSPHFSPPYLLRRRYAAPYLHWLGQSGRKIQAAHDLSSSHNEWW